VEEGQNKSIARTGALRNFQLFVGEIGSWEARHQRQRLQRQKRVLYLDPGIKWLPGRDEQSARKAVSDTLIV